MQMVHHPAVDKPQEEPHPDQRETLPFDPSPLVRTFFGDTTSVGKVQTLPEPTQAVAQTQEEEDPEIAEILRAPTRRLDSFADAEEPMPEASMPDPSTVAPSLDSNLIPKSPEDVPRDSVRRSLTSVFDQEVELTRLEQQSWKAEVETDETAIGGEPEKKVKKKPGRKKGQKNKGKKQGQKSKGKKNKGTKEDTKREKTQRAGKKVEKVEEVVEEPPKPKPRKRKAKVQAEVQAEVPEVVLETPRARKKTAATSSRSKQDKQDNRKDGNGGEGRKTFARRYRPLSANGACLWDALKAAFVATIGVQVVAPSKKEA